jgi:hypothetical protein
LGRFCAVVQDQAGVGTWNRRRPQELDSSLTSQKKVFAGVGLLVE